MKKTIYIITLGLTLFATSCKETLEVKPQDSIDGSTALTTMTGINSLLATVYSTFRGTGYYGQSVMINPDVMADNAYPIPGLNSGRLTLNSTNTSGAHMSLWGLYTGGLNNVNILLDALPSASGSAAEKNVAYSQAYALRAIFYWDMVKLYGWNPLHIQNGFNLGVPIVLKSTNSVSEITYPARNTVEEVYKQIETDLLAAENLAVASTATTAPTYLHKAAIQAYLAKVYLYWGKYDKAATYADKVIAVKGNSFASGAAYVSNYYLDVNPEAIFETVVTQVQSAGNESIQSIYSQFPSEYAKRNSQAAFDSDAEVKVGYGDFTPTPELLAAFEPGDIRRGTITTGRKSLTTVNYVRKWTPTQGANFIKNITLMRISEMYLIRGEANLRAGSAIGATPQADLDKIRLRAGLASIPVTVDAILKERRIELAFEGDRWFDLVRLGLAIPKSTALGSSIVPLAANDFRILAPIPVSELNVNPNLVKNAGY
jgi:hypothetical protein